MANITQTSQIDLTARGMLGEAPKDSDLVVVKDVSDGTSGGGGRDKYVTIGNLVKSVGSVQGLAGSAGATGPQGPQGPQGAKGDQGIQGLSGLSGQDGAQGPQGIQGLRGAPGATGISPAGLAWQGTWVSGRSYEVNDTVAYGGASYFCITGNSGTTSPDQSVDFALLAAQGADGVAGANGQDGASGTQGVQGQQGPVGPRGPEGPAGIDGLQGVDGSAGAQGPVGPQGAAGVTVFSELDQIPDTLNPGAYLRVNSTGDGLINVNQAPPDGGIRSIPQINARNKTGLPIPDKVMFMWAGNMYPVFFMTMTETDIYYSFDIADNDYMRVRFSNTPDGPNVGSSQSRYFPSGSTSYNNSPRDPRTYQYSLKQFIYPSARPDPTDTDKLVIFEGQQSGTSGVGNLNVIKAQTEVFYTELPDAIVATMRGGHEGILRLKFAKNISSQSNGTNFYYEARISTTGGNANDYLAVFKDDTDGTFMGHAGQSDQFPTDGSMDQNLRWFIENGRALYYGGSVGIGLGEHSKFQTATFPGILPDKIILASGTTPIAFQLAYVSSTQIAYYDTRASGKRYNFDQNGIYSADTTDTPYIPFEGDGADLQEIIDGGHAVYHGKR